MKKQTIERLIRAYQGDDLAGYLAAELERERQLRSELDRLKIAEHDLWQQHNKARLELNAECVTLQKSCPHHETTYYPDPAGGSDSDTICDLCGLWGVPHTS